MGNWIEEALGNDLSAYDEFAKPTGDFDLLPANTRVLCVVEEVKGKTNKNGELYPAMTLRAVALPAGLPAGNYGKPKFFDNSRLTLPANPAKFAGQPDDVVKKAKMSAGMFVRRVKALGLDPAQADGGLTETSVQMFFFRAVGSQVIVRVGQEPAKGEYRAKNTVADYEPATDAAIAKHGLTVPVGEQAVEVPF